jgi:hypothetical protein
MGPFFWLLLILSTFSAGICLPQFLVASPLRMARRLAAGSLQKLLIIPASIKNQSTAHYPTSSLFTK